LRFDEGRAEWELMMFQSPGARSTQLHPEGLPIHLTPIAQMH
jgi:hypothetical protein